LGCLHVGDAVVVASVAELGGLFVVVVVVVILTDELVDFDVEVGGGGTVDELEVLEVDVEVGGGENEELVFVVTEVEVGGGGLVDELVLEELDVEEEVGGGGGDFVDVLGCEMLELVLP
jgi:hypothetical protein